MIPLTSAAAEARAETFNLKMAAGSEKLRTIKDEDVQIATTPKDEVWPGQGHALPLPAARAKQNVKTPVLIAYGLIGRYTMADLQEDRSLVRNLLARGVDLYVVDWGNPSRADRWLTHRRLRRRLPRRMRRSTSARARHRQDQPARHLRGRRVHAVLRRAPPGAGART